MVETVNRTLKILADLIDNDEFQSNESLRRKYGFKENQLKRIQNTTRAIRDSLATPDEGLGQYFEWVKQGTKFTIRSKFKENK